MDRMIDGRLLGSGCVLRSATGPTASPSTSAPGKRATGAAVAQSGVQQLILSWSGAMPFSAPPIVQLTDGAALAAPGLPINDSAIRRAIMSFIENLLHVCWAFRKAAERCGLFLPRDTDRLHNELVYRSPPDRPSSTA